MKVRIITTTNADYRAELAAYSKPPAHGNIPSLPTARLPVPVYYRVQYRAFLWHWIRWGCPLDSLLRMFSWLSWADPDSGDSNYDTYEQALRSANQCWRWLCLQKNDPSYAVVEYAPGAQESLYDQ
jgi:hypothetical protein